MRKEKTTLTLFPITAPPCPFPFPRSNKSNPRCIQAARRWAYGNAAAVGGQQGAGAAVGLQLGCAGTGGRRRGPRRPRSAARACPAARWSRRSAVRGRGRGLQKLVYLGPRQAPLPRRGGPRPDPQDVFQPPRRPAGGTAMARIPYWRCCGRSGSGAMTLALGQGLAAASVAPLAMVLCRRWGRELALPATVLPAIPLCRAVWACTLATHAPPPAMLCTAGNALLEPLATNRCHWVLLFAHLAIWHKVALCCKFLILLCFLQERRRVV